MQSFTGVARWLNGVNVFLNILFVSIATYEPKMKEQAQSNWMEMNLFWNR